MWQALRNYNNTTCAIRVVFSEMCVRTRMHTHTHTHTPVKPRQVQQSPVFSWPLPATHSVLAIHHPWTCGMYSREQLDTLSLETHNNWMRYVGLDCSCSNWACQFGRTNSWTDAQTACQNTTTTHIVRIKQRCVPQWLKTHTHWTSSSFYKFGETFSKLNWLCKYVVMETYNIFHNVYT